MTYLFPILIAISLAVPMNVNAREQAPFSLDSLNIKNELAPYVEYHRDRDGTLNINSAASREFEEYFVPLIKKSSFGYSKDSFWFRLKVNNPFNYSVEWYFEYPYAVVDRFDFYQPSPYHFFQPREFEVFQSGDHYPFSVRPLNYRTSVIPVHTPPGITTYYFNIHSQGSIVTSFIAWEKDAMHTHMDRDALINWIYFGVMFATVVFNFFIFLSVRERAYLYLMIFVAGASLFTMNHTGLSFQYLWPESIWWANVCHPFAGLTAFSGGLLFTASFLSTATRMPRIHRYIKISLGLGLCIMFAVFFIPYSMATQSMVVFSVVSVLIMLTSGTILFIKGERVGRFYMAAWSGILIAVVVMTLKTYGFLENNIWTDSGVQLSVVWLVILLSFGLVDKINMIQKDKFRALEQLAHSERRYRMLADSIKEVIWTLDIHTLKINYITPSVEAMTGYTPEEAKRDFTFKKMLPPEAARRAMASVSQGIGAGRRQMSNSFDAEKSAEGKTNKENSSNKNKENSSNMNLNEPGKTGSQYVHPLGKPMEVEFYTKSGGVIWTETTLTFIRDGNGNPMEMMGVTRDVTKRKKSEEEKKALELQLVQTNKLEAIGTLAGGIAHDMNNILTAVMGYVEMCRSDSEPGSRIYQRLDRVIHACYRARDLVGQILTFSRQDHQESIPLNINPMVKEVMQLIRASIPATIDIQISVPREKFIVIADPTKIHQIVMNLCTNAAYAMENPGAESPGKKVLGVSTEVMVLDEESAENYLDLEPGEYVRLTVSDTGQGMDKETMKRIFEPFFTTKPRGKGTGMGLAMVHGIVTKMGGGVYVYSEIGLGTTFHLLLPRAPDNVDADSTAVFSSDLKGGNETLLYVDDEADIVEVAREMLQSLGYEVIGETSSPRALALFKDYPQRFDLVITDQNMPSMTGSELARHIWKIRPGIPVILCTGFNELITAQTAVKAGISQYIMKPYSKYDIAAKIRRSLQ
ncbi:MAG: response regulator [Desulfamplus sp.]|nr:response regulator [Desulfamplus sp.]